eukprot:gene4606-5753_t
MIDKLSTKKLERITFINKLQSDLQQVSNGFDLIYSQVSIQIVEIKQIVDSLQEDVEDFKPAHQKNLLKSKSKSLESELIINQLSTELKDLQFRGLKAHTDVIRARDLEREIQQHRDKIRSAGVYYHGGGGGGNGVENGNSKNLKLRLMNSNSQSLNHSVKRIYQNLDGFSKQLKVYFDTVYDIHRKVPQLRGGLDLGLLSIGGDESTEILERMCESIYQSSKLTLKFLAELPGLQFNSSTASSSSNGGDKNWLELHLQLFKQFSPSSSSINNSDNSDKSSLNRSTDKKFGIFKKTKTMRSEVNLLEKIVIMESENYNSNGNSNNNNNQSKQKQQQQNINQKSEPINTTLTQIDALLADIQKLLGFPEKDIQSHLVPIESKCQTLLNVLVLLLNRIHSYQEVLEKWIENNTIILRVASYESDSMGFEIPDFKSIPDIQQKLKILLKIVHSHQTICPIATPMVYQNDNAWKMTNYSDLRATRRQEIEKMLSILKSNYPIDLDILRKCIIEFSDCLVQILHVKIPLMFEVFEDDSTLFSTKNWANERKLMRETIIKSHHKLKFVNSSSSSSQEQLSYCLRVLQSVLLKFFTFKPIGRPHVYKNDKEWKILNESKQRYEYRTSILI